MHSGIEIPCQRIGQRLQHGLEPGEIVVEGAAGDARTRAQVLDARVAPMGPAKELQCRDQQLGAGAGALRRPDLGTPGLVDPAARARGHGPEY